MTKKRKDFPRNKYECEYKYEYEYRILHVNVYEHILTYIMVKMQDQDLSSCNTKEIKNLHNEADIATELKFIKHGENTCIRIILDDSSSMQNHLNNETIKYYDCIEPLLKRPDGKPIISQFDEAMTMLYHMMNTLAMVDIEFDFILEFINMKDKFVAYGKDGHSFAQVQNKIKNMLENKLPYGSTLLYNKLKEIEIEDKSFQGQNNILVLILYGEPNNEGFDPDTLNRMIELLHERQKESNAYLQIVIPSDDLRNVESLRRLEDELPRTDIFDGIFIMYD